MTTQRNQQMDEHGFTRGFTRKSSGVLSNSGGYGRLHTDQIRSMAGVAPADELFRVSVSNGVRSTSRVGSGMVAVKPGDNFVGGPKCQLAADARADAVRRQLDGLRDLGFGQPTASADAHGVRVRLKGFTLPGGSRTDMLILLPRAYPDVPPIGFYLRGDARTGGLDLDHLFPDRAFHQAPNLSGEQERWRWYCLIVDGWDPGRHNLAGFVGQVSAALAAGRQEA